MNNLTVVGTIKFGNLSLKAYGSMDNPIFRASDVANAIGYSDGNVWKMTQMCEEDEKLNLPMFVAGQTRHVAFITESGLYNILNQSRTPEAIEWREEQHIGAKLVGARKSKGMSIVDQFNIWNEMID